jgi:ribosomal protein S18 acetylase RimI-like enzyme
MSMKIEMGLECDIDNWMNLVYKVKDYFPGLETKEALDNHKNTVLEFMSQKSAICTKHDDKIIGVLLFSIDNNELCFLAVDENYRRQHIADNMISYMLTFMDDKKDVVVTTYRKEVPEGIAARAFYKSLGFQEGQLTEEFGSPVQKFVLKR